MHIVSVTMVLREWVQVHKDSDARDKKQKVFILNFSIINTRKSQGGKNTRENTVKWRTQENTGGKMFKKLETQRADKELGKFTQRSSRETNGTGNLNTP